MDFYQSTCHDFGFIFQKKNFPFPAPVAFVSFTAPHTMLISAIKLKIPLSTAAAATASNVAANLLFSSTAFHKPSHSGTKPLLLTTTTTTTNASSSSPPLENALHHVRETLPDPRQEAEPSEISSASAVVSAIRGCSTSPVDFSQTVEDNGNHKLILPSPDFQRLCVQQLDLFRRIVHPDAILSVYVRPAGSYVMDRLELRRVTLYPCVDVNSSDIVILVGNFSVPTGLRSAEASLCNQQVEIVPEYSAIVFPMVKHPFVVGFLVAELPKMELERLRMNGHKEERDLMQFPSPGEDHALSYPKPWGIQNNDEPVSYNLSADQRSNAINISHTLAMAYVMDQKSILLQQSSWQINIRMSNLVEQIRGPLSSIRTLSKMLSIHSKRSEISYDIVEDIMVQGDRIRDTLQELQEAVYLTKENIVRYNEDALKKIDTSTHTYPESVRSQLPDNFPRHNGHELQDSGDTLFLDTASKDIEMPMPPLTLAPLKQHGIRPSDVSEVLLDLVEAVRPLANKQQRILEFSKLSQSLQVAIEEPSLRQALSNLIEGALLRTHAGGKVEIMTTGAPGGGALVIIDDDGPDMHYMTQTHSLTPFGAELSSENMIEDNMTWNFVAGLTVAREILESYGCVVRVRSPRIAGAALGSGGTRVELWLPSLVAVSDSNGVVHEA